MTIPTRSTAAPGVIMVGGSGASDRNNGGYFTLIRRHLVDAGIAVLSYDKRGVGGSGGDWRTGTLDDLARDAIAAREFLRAQPGVRADEVGLFGHSEGGWVVLRAAADDEDIPWLITNSGPATTPAIQNRYGLTKALQLDTAATVHDINTVLAVYDRIADARRRDADVAEIKRLLTSTGRYSDLVEDWAEVDERSRVFHKHKQDHDPIPDVHRLRCPHLAIFGTADTLIPVADSIHLLATAAHHPDRDAAGLTIEIFAGADHRIQTCGSARLAPGYLETLTRWITARIRSGAMQVAD